MTIKTLNKTLKWNTDSANFSLSIRPNKTLKKRDNLKKLLPSLKKQRELIQGPIIKNVENIDLSNVKINPSTLLHVQSDFQELFVATKRF